jgi:hypothetical protein
MCTHDAEKLAISVLELYEDGYRNDEQPNKLQIEEIQNEGFIFQNRDIRKCGDYRSAIRWF